MREIKFRAWDHTRNKFSTSGNLMLDMRGTKYWQFGNEPPDPIVKQDDFVLQQFTGLKDKNGVEIYEGDLVKTSFYYGDDYGNPVGNMEEQIIEVEWEIEKIRQYAGFSLYPSQNIDKLEVVGNIYENPGLLEQGVLKRGESA